jgi:hypothetical protein
MMCCRSLPNVQHVVESSLGSDKMVVLDNLLSQHDKKGFRTMVLCNTLDSCRLW